MSAPELPPDAAPDFGHTPRQLAWWRDLVEQALLDTPTPFYLFSAEPVQEALAELEAACATVPVPVRHWLSCKTQPVRPLIEWWVRQGRPVEVVSEFEFRAAIEAGCPPERLLVNGPVKDRWLPAVACPGLIVHFDSAREAEALLPLAKEQGWRTGVRCHTQEEFDPENRPLPTQFGMEAAEAVAVIQCLRSALVQVEGIHFHLRTNLASPQFVERAISELLQVCAAADFQPRYLDVGGGLPPPHITTRGGKFYNAGFALSEFARVLTRAARSLPGLQEIWCENGRFVSGRSGVLVTRVLEVKERRGLRQLICDAGRTMSALVSTWELHDLFSIPQRAGLETETVVCGPTCMAFDQLVRRPLPRSIGIGDQIVWMDAGAYHIPWETRFSHGWSAVLWHEAGAPLRVVRSAETFEHWWGCWSSNIP